MVTNIGMGDDVGDRYTCEKFHYDPIRGFCAPPLRPRARVQSDSASFFSWGREEQRILAIPYSAKPSAPIFTINTSNDVVLRKDVPFGIPKTKFYISTTIFPKTANLGPIFDGIEIFGSEMP